MVYLPPRARNYTCQMTWETPPGDAVAQCQEEGKQPYCWPPNGTGMCGGGIEEMLFYWPPSFYHENASLRVDFGNRTTPRSDSPGAIRADRQVTQLTDYEKYAKLAPNSSYEKILHITIREWYALLDTITSTDHAGPTLTLVLPEPTAVVTTPTYGPSVTALAGMSMGGGGSSSKGPGKTVSIVFGAALGAVVLGVLLFWCCGGCCCAGEQEEERVRRQEARRVASEVAAAQPQIDAIKQSAARGEIWTGPARAGGSWATEMPRRPSRVRSRPASVASDEIRAVNIVEEQMAEERRIEARRQEIARAEESRPPAYDATTAPPRYAP